MYPSIDILGLSLPTGPLALIAAFYAGLWLAGREADRLDLDPNLPWDFGTAALVAGIVGARGWYVAVNWPAYALDWKQAFALASGSLAIAPGAIIGIVVGLIWIGRRGVDWPAFADALAPGLALMQAIAGLGAFLSGEAYGEPSNVPWAIQLWGEARHPVQIYEALVGSAVLVGLWYLRRSKLYAGFVFLLYVLLAAVGRLFLEAFRGNPALLPGGFRTMQVLSLAIALVAWLTLYARKAGPLRLMPSKRTGQE
ncbi:MAG: prolipoprotein diacylglyceryl transferase [Anaerolineae bacterium]